jgi:hypothetical protein
MQLNILHLHSANNGATARTGQPEGSSCRNRGAKQSNPFVLSFLETHTPGGSLCTPPVSARRGLELNDIKNPLVKWIKRFIQTSMDE